MNIKKDFEKSICRKFINGSNVIPSYKTTYKLIEEDREAPDFVIKDSKENKIGLEITSAYHDQDRAKGFWKPLRSNKEDIYDSRGNCIRGKIPLKDVILNPDIKLASFVKNKIDKKCMNDYGLQCILIIFVGDPLWSDRTLIQIRKTSKVPERNPFFEIYVCVDVPSSTEFSPYSGGRVFFRIYPSTNKLHNLDQETYKKLKKNFEEQCKQLEKMSLEDMEAKFKNLKF
jgi:predicted transcriptional regulator